MNALIDRPRFAALVTSAQRIGRGAGIGLVLGAAGGAVFGFAFGSVAALAWGWKILAVVGYFALCGAAAGGIVGTCGAVFQFDDELTLTAFLSVRRRDQRRQATPLGQIVVSRDHGIEDRLSAFTRSDRRRAELHATENPSPN